MTFVYETKIGGKHLVVEYCFVFCNWSYQNS